jgi:hypothetical protein
MTSEAVEYSWAGIMGLSEVPGICGVDLVIAGAGTEVAMDEATAGAVPTLGAGFSPVGIAQIA